MAGKLAKTNQKILRFRCAAAHYSTKSIKEIEKLEIISLLALSIGVYFRINPNHNRPFWVDETFTGAIVNQSTLHDFFHQIWADVNAPLYYCILYAWSYMSDLSNTSLRLPSLAMSIAVLIIVFKATKTFDRTTCLLWGSLMCLWLPGIDQASEARCYSLLLLTSTMTTLSFANLIDSPNRRAASYWALYGSATILTHYFSLILIAFQSIVFLALHRKKAVELSVALLIFIIPISWILYHLPRLLAFAALDVAWYSRLNIDHIPVIISYTLNSFGFIAFLFVCAYFIIRKYEDAEILRFRNATIVAATSAAALLAFIIIGFARPSFSLRYCVPFIPGVLLGASLMGKFAARAWPVTPVLAIALFSIPTFLDTGAASSTATYSFEAASIEIRKAGVKRLVFLWDHPSSVIQDDSQMRSVGGFFLDRAGQQIQVVNVSNAWREDPQPRLLLAAQSDPDTAILWVYDRLLSQTAALKYPPNIEEIDPSWRCRNYAKAPYAALVCLRPRV
ncbi:hypothetical protein FV222_04880 [Methylobacterium sp. WL103]|uniref:hypothetical protein n=1 Tax=Methylobacterium sp. WL103 TaxID=2603891 RepID=UPI0011C93EAA|nr:hypothetical protein [Methylobacterium sp. WL103]TXN06656.1 hypothetical protein FV222_04880 [Methylobacterium sp. WL103]